MFGFYPGNSITLRGDPELSAALEKWLDPRPARNWFNSTWDVCSWARLENGLRADSVMRGVLRTRSPRGGIGNNLHNSVSNQSDLNFGLTASIAECLLQSHAGEISLLPALPVSWENGSVTGLKARGGFEVNIEWKERKLVKAEIKSLLGNPCIIRANGKTTNYSPAKGETIVIKGT
jgi:alpha-L-fucosidase 2